MKIIAETNSSSYRKRFLVEVGSDELDFIIGKPYNDRSFKIGDEIKVTEQFKRLQNLDNNKGAVNDCKKQLRALADMMESFDPVVRKLIDPQWSEPENGTPTNEVKE